MKELSEANRALFDKVWKECVGPPRTSFWFALNRLLDAARDEGRIEGREGGFAQAARDFAGPASL